MLEILWKEWNQKAWLNELKYKITLLLEKTAEKMAEVLDIGITT
jgi:hypothetical protein